MFEMQQCLRVCFAKRTVKIRLESRKRQMKLQKKAKKGLASAVLKRFRRMEIYYPTNPFPRLGKFPKFQLQQNVISIIFVISFNE